MKTIKNKNVSTRKSFFHQNCAVLIGDETVYFNEIIKPSQFKRIYSKEVVLIRLKKEINTEAARPFLNIPSTSPKQINTKTRNVLILRIKNINKIYEIISPVYSWGKVNIPRKVISTLNIKHQQKVSIGVVKEANQFQEGKMDLSQLFKGKKNIKILRRTAGFITIFSPGKLPITLPNSIILGPKLVEAFFLIHGDGHYGRNFFFTNNDINLHKFVIKVFEEELKIPTTIWRARVNLNESHEIELAVSYWLKNTGLDVQQLYPSISRTKFNTSPEGNLRICIDYPIVTEVFRTIFDFMKENLNKRLSFYALNGLLAAEGGAQIDEVGLHRITLSYNQKEKELFKKVLKTCGLVHLFKDKNKGNHGTFVLEGWEKLYSFFKEFSVRKVIPFSLHNDRKQRAITGIISHSFTKTMCAYLSILSQNEKFTTKEFSKRLQIREDSCLRTLRKDQYSPFINIEGLGINRHPFTISITDQGKELLNIISTLRGEANAMNKQIFIKKGSEGNFGKNPKERTPKELIQYGIVNIDKPKGPTKA